MAIILKSVYQFVLFSPSYFQNITDPSVCGVDMRVGRENASTIDCAVLGASAPTSLCPICQSGYYCPQYNVSAFVLCQKGAYCPLNSSSPFLCPAGTYGNVTGVRMFRVYVCVLAVLPLTILKFLCQVSRQFLIAKRAQPTPAAQLVQQVTHSCLLPLVVVSAPQVPTINQDTKLRVQ